MTAFAPGGPGSAPRWTSTDKSGVGTALWSTSSVWFTLSHGILNEVYYPAVDIACLRDIGMIVTANDGFFSEEKRDANSRVSLEDDGVPSYRLSNRCKRGRYEIQKSILTDPRRSVLLQQTRFIPLQGEASDYQMFLLVAPHINNNGNNNTAWVGDYRGVRLLFAQRGDISLAVGCSVPFKNLSVGFVGQSDGWQDITRNKKMTWSYDVAENGNVALTAEIDPSSAHSFVFAFGFGATPEEAAMRVQHSFLEGFDAARRTYVTGWQHLQDSLLPLDRLSPRPRDLYRNSIAMLRVHEDKRFSGAVIPSLSIPWEIDKGASTLGEYHLVWPRDLARAGAAFIAAGARAEALRVLRYLAATQESDGRWAQSMSVDGQAHINSPQTDEPAAAILLVDLARRERLLDGAGEMERFWPMVRRAVEFIARSGPVVLEDRTDQDPGFSPGSLALCVAALLVAADLADDHSEPEVAAYLRESADVWNDGIDQWTYVRGTDPAQWAGVDGYYARLAPRDEPTFCTPRPGLNSAPMLGPVEFCITPDALSLVRLGLRTADDPRVMDTVRVIDDGLKVDTPMGPSWHRYSDDTYGEHDDGSVFDGVGVGRAWPLLTGERAHFELAGGNRRGAEELATALECFANEGRLLSQQIWDADDIPGSNLYFGRPTGAALPYMWAHAEYVLLRRSLYEGRLFDTPPQTLARYCARRSPARHTIWRFNHKAREVRAGLPVRIETLAAAEVHASIDAWASRTVTPSRDVGLGLHVIDLPPLEAGALLEFTFFWPQAERWENQQFAVRAV